jgi:hypothetical protein
MEHIFHKIILNIYFDHIHIMCLYKVFSVLYASLYRGHTLKELGAADCAHGRG